MRKLLFLAISFLLLCNMVYAEEKLTQSENGNFILYVSNQSFAINPVDIKVIIDDRIAFNEIFDVKGKQTPQHNWKKFQFDLSSGVHRIRVESKKGKAILEKDIEIKNRHWAVLDYWYYPKVSEGAGPTPKHFSFDIKDEPIYFE